MQCPHCSAAQPEGAAECSGCGVVFAKWRPRAPRPAPAPEPADPHWTRPTLRNFLYWGVIGLISSYTWRNHVRPRVMPAKPPRAAAPAPQAAAPETPESAEDPHARLEPILEQINSELSGHGVTATRLGISHDFDKANQALHPSVLAHYGPKAGLPAPEFRQFDEIDRARFDRQLARFLRHGERGYGPNCPTPSEGVEECWERPLDGAGGALTVYERLQWQPHNGRWVLYDEAGERRIIEYLIAEAHGFAAQSREREAARAALARESVMPGRSEANIRNAVVTGYRSVVAREGYRRRLEVMDSWK